MPKVLISDSMSNVAQKIFEKNNISVDVKTGLSEEEIIKIIPDYDGMVVRSATKVTKNIMEAAKNLKVIGRAGAGVEATSDSLVSALQPKPSQRTMPMHKYRVLIANPQSML